jgi:hypothetical protein
MDILRQHRRQLASNIPGYFVHTAGSGHISNGVIYCSRSRSFRLNHTIRGASPWSVMSFGRLSARKPIKPGYGLHCVGKRGRLWRLSWVIGVRRRVESSGARYRRAIGVVSAMDFWTAYQGVIPSKQHRAVGKETGETAHMERLNNTLRQHSQHP